MALELSFGIDKLAWLANGKERTYTSLLVGDQGFLSNFEDPAIVEGLSNSSSRTEAHLDASTAHELVLNIPWETQRHKKVRRTHLNPCQAHDNIPLQTLPSKQARRVQLDAPKAHDNIQLGTPCSKEVRRAPLNGSKAHKVQQNIQWDTLRPKEALASLRCMDDLPSLDNMVCIMQTFRKHRNLAYAKSLQVHICDYGLEAHSIVGNYLIPMFVDCGGMPFAQQVCNRLNHRNEYSWVSLIQGYTDDGEPQHALELYPKMQADYVHPGRHAFVALLKACISLNCLEQGRHLHAEITDKGLHKDPYVGSTLVDMYAKCGSLTEAQETFDGLPVRPVVSWTALIAGYAQQGLSKEALNCFQQMQSEGVPPDSVTFVCCLTACGSIGALEKGQHLQHEILKKGLEGDPYVCMSLVDMYAKCGVLAEAREVLYKQPVRDVVSWTSLIGGYVELGMGKEAFDCFQEMELEGVSPDPAAYICTLQACGSIRSVEKGREIHMEMVKRGLERLLFVGNALVNMYVKCSSLIESQMVFNKLPVRDVVSWTALMTGYVELGVGEEALDCSEQMQSECISPNDVTFICSLKACDSTGAIGRGQETHSEIVKKGFENDGVVGNTLIDMYAKCGLLAEARAVFDKLLVRDVVSWNALIAGYAEHECGEEALNCLERMQLEGLSLDAFTLIGSLRACGSIQELEKGQGVHMEVVKKGCEREPFVGNTIVDMYAKCGSLADSCAVFDRLPVRDVVSWNALITGYAEQGYDEEAFKYLEQMQLEGVLPDAISWNAVIFSSAEQGESEKAIQLHAQMQEQGLLPEGAVSLSVLKACGNIAALEMGQKIHTQIYRVGGFKATEVYLANGFIDMYSKCGSVDSAQQVFDAMPTRDIVTWNVLIGGYSRQGESKLVLSLLGRMIKEGVQPDEVTFLSILAVYNHAGLLHQGHTVFEAMRAEFGISPTIKHYSSMVDLLGRAGRLGEAALLLEEMPFEPNLTVCHSVLCACRRWGNVEIALQVFECAVRLDPNHPAAYILMSSIYSDADMLEDAKKIDARRVDIKEKELS